MTICALFSNRMFLLGSAVDFSRTGFDLFGSTALLLQSLLTLYFRVLLLLLEGMIGLADNKAALRSSS